MFKSIESFKSAFPYFLGCRPNYTSQAVSVSSLVKIRLWLYYYGSARKSYLQMLDPIHNQGLRLALGAFRTSPVASLYVEADEPPLYIRREKLSLQYAILLLTHQILLMKLHSHQIMFIYMNRNLKLLNHLASEFHHS